MTELHFTLYIDWTYKNSTRNALYRLQTIDSHFQSLQGPLRPEGKHHLSLTCSFLLVWGVIGVVRIFNFVQIKLAKADLLPAAHISFFNLFLFSSLRKKKQKTSKIFGCMYGLRCITECSAWSHQACRSQHQTYLLRWWKNQFYFSSIVFTLKFCKQREYTNLRFHSHYNPLAMCRLKSLSILP